MLSAPQHSIGMPHGSTLSIERAMPWLLAAAVVIAAAFATSATAINHDVASYLLMARALSDGRVLYETFPDFSMPANAWIALLSLKIATAASWELAAVHQGLIFSATLCGAGLTAMIMAGAAGPETLAARLAPPLIATVFLFVPGYDAGQRDVMFAVLTAPLVAIVAARHLGLSPDRALSVAVVILATIGSSLKPQVALPLLTLGLCDLALHQGRIRRLAPEIWGLAGLLAIYGLAVHLAYPDYFTRVLPAAAKSYSVLQSPPDKLLDHVAVLIVVGVVAILLLAPVIRDRRAAGRPVPGGLIAAWGVFGASLVAMYLQQHMGFRYQAVPALLFAVVSVAMFGGLALDAAGRRWRSGGRWWAGGWIAATVVLGLLAFRTAVLFSAPAETRRTDVDNGRITAVLRALPQDSYVLSLQTGVPPISPLHAYATVRWSGEFSSIYEIAGIVLDAEQAAAEQRPRDPWFVALESDVRTRVLRSLTDRPPEVVLVDVTQPLRWLEWLERPFGLVAWLEQDPAFAAAWSTYTCTETAPSYPGLTVEIWRRRPVDTPADWSATPCRP